VAIGVSSQNNKPLSCLTAQAVAARTFAFNQTYNPANPTTPLMINNTNEKQVYIPYRYLGLTSEQQANIDEAIAFILYRDCYPR
jgi:peptidoglycan hydrolase-like amidase